MSTILFLSRKLDRGALAAIKDAGVGSIELFMQRPHFDPGSDRDVKALRSVLDETGIGVISAHMPIYRFRMKGRAERKALTLSLSSSDAALRKETVEELGAAIQAASGFGAKNMVVHTGIKAEGLDGEVERCIDSLSGPAKLAENLGVRLALENGTDPGTTVSILKRVIGESGLPNLGICIDVGHANLFSSPLKDIADAAGYLLSLHIHDNNGKQDQHLLPGGGTIDFSEVFSTLGLIKFQGICTFEVGPAPGTDSEDQATLGVQASKIGAAVAFFKREMAD